MSSLALEDRVFNSGQSPVYFYMAVSKTSDWLFFSMKPIMPLMVTDLLNVNRKLTQTMLLEDLSFES